MNAPIDSVPFALPYMGLEEEEAVLRVIRSHWLTTGGEALAFEREFAAFLERKQEETPVAGESPGALHALAVNSATSGLHLAFEACGVVPGDVVLTSPYTFTSTAEVARYLGAEVAFVDVAPGSYLMDPEALERTIQRLQRGEPAYEAPSDYGGRKKGDRFGPRGRPAVIAPVHVAGLPCDMKKILTIAQTYGLKTVEDAAHSFPARLPDGRWAGTVADAGVFSFYATKTITTGEGGMVVTRNSNIAERVSVMRSHGIDRAVWNRYTDRRASWRYAVVEAGFKYNLPDLLAAIGRVQLSRAERLLEMRRSIAQSYDQAFGSDPRFFIPPSSPGDARHLYPLRLSGTWGKEQRDRFIELLQDRNIGVSVHFIPLHTMPYYQKKYDLRPEDFPQALDQFERTISLPIWPGMEKGHVDRVIDAVRSVAESLNRGAQG